MEAADVSEIVSSELRSATKSEHGWEFRQFLVDPPRKETYRDANGVPWRVWVVLRESDDGYIVAYDEEDGDFCLVTGGVVISSYESLMGAINGM